MVRQSGPRGWRAAAQAWGKRGREWRGRAAAVWGGSMPWILWRSSSASLEPTPPLLPPPPRIRVISSESAMSGSAMAVSPRYESPSPVRRAALALAAHQLTALAGRIRVPRWVTRFRVIRIGVISIRVTRVYKSPVSEAPYPSRPYPSHLHLSHRYPSYPHPSSSHPHLSNPYPNDPHPSHAYSSHSSRSCHPYPSHQYPSSLCPEVRRGALGPNPTFVRGF